MSNLTPEEQRYLKLMEERASLLPEDGLDMEADELGAPRQSNAALDTAGQSAAPKSSGLSAAGDQVAMGGAMGGNPYVAGAGMGLKTIGMIDDAKRQSEQAKIDAYNKKIMAQRSAIRNMFA